MKKKSMPFFREKSVGRLNASPSKNAGSNVVANTTEDEQKFNEEKKTDKDKSFVVKITARVSRSEKKRDAEKNQGDGEDEVAEKNQGDVKDEVTDKNEEDVKDGVDKTEAAEENTLQKEKFLGERVSEKIGHADKINKEKSFVEKITARVSRSDKKGKAEKNQEHVKDEVAAKKEEEIQVEVADHTEAAEVKAFKKEKSFVGRISEKVGHADKKGDAADTVKHKVKEADLIYEKMDAVLETLSKALLEQHKAMKGADERKIETVKIIAALAEGTILQKVVRRKETDHLQVEPGKLPKEKEDAKHVQLEIDAAGDTEEVIEQNRHECKANENSQGGQNKLEVEDYLDAGRQTSQGKTILIDSNEESDEDQITRDSQYESEEVLISDDKETAESEEILISDDKETDESEEILISEDKETDESEEILISDDKEIMIIKKPEAENLSEAEVCAASAEDEATSGSKDDAHVEEIEALYDPFPTPPVIDSDSLSGAGQDLPNYHGIHLTLYENSSSHLEEFTKDIMTYVETWRKVNKTRIKAGLYEFKELDEKLEHYSDKVKSLEKSKNKEKVERNEHKLLGVREAHSTYSAKLLRYYEEVTVRGWRDLYPLLLKMLQFDLSYAADQYHLASQLSLVIDDLRHLGIEHGLQKDGRLKELEEEPLGDVFTGERKMGSRF